MSSGVLACILPRRHCVGTWIFAKRSDDRDDEIDREESARLSLWVWLILTAVTNLFYLYFYAHVRIAGKS